MRSLHVLLLVSLVFLGACSVVIQPGGEPGGWKRGPRDDSTTIAEIDAAAGLSFDSGKESAFKNIAARPGLSGKAQSYLIHRAMRSLSFDNAKETVMLTLIANPDFLAEGKQAILEDLNRLSFDSGKERVLRALSDRGDVPSENEVEIIIQDQPESVIIEPSFEVQAGVQTDL